MQESVKIAVDAMGGDNAPGIAVKGAVDAVNERNEIFVWLVGIEDQVKAELEKYEYPKERIMIVHASEVIEMGDVPTAAIRQKKDSSIVVGMNLVKEGKADAFVSAGSTGALLVGGQTIVRRIRGIGRAPLATLLPTENGATLLIDCGANVDARSEHLVQFAKMGSIYMEHVVGVKNPSVGIINIGTEEEKGNALVKETYPLLKASKEINFTGSVEARDIMKGTADVLVCEAFVGNVVLKLVEGEASTLMHMMKKSLMSSLRSKIGALLIKPALKEMLKSFDANQYGGAPLLGLNGLVVKCHGSSDAQAIKTAVIQCIAFKEQGINEKIKEFIDAEKEA